MKQSSVLRPRRSGDPLSVQQQVVVGLEQQFNDTTIDDVARGYAALEIGCSYITGYGHASKDFDAALAWIERSRIWSAARFISSRLHYALGKKVTLDEAQFNELMYCASQGSDIAMEEVQRLNPEKGQAVLRLRREHLEGVGSMIFDIKTSDRFNVHDVDELERQITQADMPPAAEVEVVPGKVRLLHFAASRGEPNAIECLIRNGCDVNAVDVEGETPLLFACRAGHPATALALLKNGADITLSRRSTKETPLHWAVNIDGDRVEEVIRAMPSDQLSTLLNAQAENPSYGAAITPAYGDGTPLTWAVAFNRPELLTVLLDLGADPWVESSYTRHCAVVLAASLHRSETLEMMLRKYPTTKDVCQEALNDALVEAIVYGLPLRMLVHGPNHQQAMKRTIDVLLTAGADLEKLKHRNLKATALYLAVENAELDVVDHLLQNGCKEYIDTMCANYGYTPLHAAIHRGDIEIFDLLIAHGADNSIPWKWNGDEMSPIIVCTKSTREPSAVIMAGRLIAALGPEILTHLYNGEPPLAVALRFSQFELADCFLSHGADLNAEFEDHKAKTRRTLLGSLLSSGHSAHHVLLVLKYLFEFRRVTHQPLSFVVGKERKESAFHVLVGGIFDAKNAAAEQEILLYLVTKWGDREHLEHRDRPGFTPLQMAALMGRAHAVSILVDAHADVNSVNQESRSRYFGMTALDIALYSLSNPPYHGAPEGMLRKHAMCVIQTIQVLQTKGAKRRAELLTEFEQQYVRSLHLMLHGSMME
jgi:ankyrin repeat protein